MACNLNLPKNGELWQELRSGILPQDCVQSMYQFLSNFLSDFKYNFYYYSIINVTKIIKRILKFFTTVISSDLKYIIEWTMNPDPIKRPKVNDLLSLPKIHAILTKRRHWFRKAVRYRMTFFFLS